MEEIEKENTPELEPQRKRPRLSLSLKTNRRFGKPVEREDLSEAAKGVVPDNTKRRNSWAAKNLMEWAKSRSEDVPSDPVPDILACQDPAVVNKWLCRYVLETRQANGQPYPPKSIYGLLCGIQRINRDNKVPFNFLEKTDVRFQELHKTLDSVCSDLHSHGIGAKTKSADVISYEDEDSLWREGLLGCGSPRVLLNTVFFYVCLFFCLCGGQEQRLLSWQNLKRVPEDPTVYTSSTYYEYIEFASKNNQHRFRDIHAKNKCVKAYANCDDSDKCVVRILDFFKSKLPKDPKAVYLRPVEKVPSDPDKPWFVNVPVGVNTLNTIIARMCEKVEGIPKYTNHSLRATAASRLFEKNVPETEVLLDCELTREQLTTKTKLHAVL